MSRIAHAALQRGIEVDYVRRLVVHNAMPHPVDAPRIDAWPWRVKVFTLGRFAILLDGKPLRFERKTQHVPIQLLQAIIALGGRSIAETGLVDALWPESEGDSGHHALATAIHRLRQLIGKELIDRQDGRVSLNGNLAWVDAWELERLLSSAAADSPAAPCLAKLAESLRRLYQRDFLHGEPEAAWALPYRERLHARTVQTLVAKINVALAGGDLAGAEAASAIGIEIDECVEAFHRALIKIHLARGDASAAILAYRRCQRTLSNKLLAVPSEATRSLFKLAQEMAKED